MVLIYVYIQFQYIMYDVIASPPGAPRWAFMVEGWKKKHAYITLCLFTFLPSGCDLKSLVLF